MSVIVLIKDGEIVGYADGESQAKELSVLFGLSYMRINKGVGHELTNGRDMYAVEFYNLPESDPEEELKVQSVSVVKYTEATRTSTNGIQYVLASSINEAVDLATTKITAKRVEYRDVILKSITKSRTTGT